MAPKLFLDTPLTKPTLVAKIYDPLYYVFEQREGWNDTVWCADYNYAREARSYEELDSEFGGTIVPKYYGSWTCDIPTESFTGLTHRPVRLILIEHLDGPSLVDMQPTKLDEKQRHSIMGKALEALVDIEHSSVITGDISPRNIMCCGSDLKSPDLLVAIIDFGDAVIAYLCNLRTRELRF
jgi:serine/threonine protein kinase